MFIGKTRTRRSKYEDREGDWYSLLAVKDDKSFVAYTEDPWQANLPPGYQVYRIYEPFSYREAQIFSITWVRGVRGTEAKLEKGDFLANSIEW
jgi:hypothetical protein